MNDGLVKNSNDKQIIDFVNGETKKYALFGNPVAKSFSPILQNTLSRYFNINNVYAAIDIPEHKIEDALKSAHILGFSGLNITVPHKNNVIKYINHIDDTAFKIGAVNTLKLNENGYEGYNTDIYGIEKTFEKLGFNTEGKTVTIIGAGGGARAVAFVCAEKKAKKIFLINRTIEKANNIAYDLKKYYNNAIKVEVISYKDIEQIKYSDIAVQATSVGMYFQGSPITDKFFFERIQFAFDIIYSPWESEFLKIASENGVKTINGFWMLIYQGIRAFEIWNNINIGDIHSLTNDMESYYKNYFSIN